MGRRTLLVGLAAVLFFATSVAWLAGSAYAGPQVEIKISAEEEKPLPLGRPFPLPVQLKIQVACALPGGLAGCVGAKPVGTVQCDYDPFVGPVLHPITSVTLVGPTGKTLQFNSAAGPEARWAFGVAVPGQPDGQSLQAIVAAGTACNAAGVPATFVFRASDTIKSEIANKP